MNEEITAVQGTWEAATIKLQGFDSGMENVRAQILSTTQELDNKLSVDEVLLRKQSGQVEKVESTLEDI